MKPLNHVRALLIAACLIAGATGCKKTPKNPTFIPKPTTVPVEESGIASKPIVPANGSNLAQTPPPSSPIRQTPPPQNLNNPPPSNPFNGNSGPTATDLAGTQKETPVTSQPVFDPVKASDEIKGKVGERPEGTEDRTIFAGETVHFDYDKSAVKASERARVEHVAAYLKNDAKVSLRVEGNCDERGTEEYNRSLGERRALAVREYLVNLGIAPERITTLSFGEDKPINQGHDETAWAENRRAEFVLIHPTNLQ